MHMKLLMPRATWFRRSTQAVRFYVYRHHSTLITNKQKEASWNHKNIWLSPTPRDERKRRALITGNTWQ